MAKKETPLRTKLFYFTELEEIKMQRAIKEAIEFMKTYSKGYGRQPRMVDLSRYANSNYRHEEKDLHFNVQARPD